MKFCSKCGKQIDDAATFCQFCGQPQNAQPQTTPQYAYSQPAPQYTQPAQPVQPQNAYAQPNAYAAPVAPAAPVASAPKKRKIWIPILIVVLILAIGAGIGVPVYLYNNKKNESRSNSSTAESAAKAFVKAMYMDLDADAMYDISISDKMLSYMENKESVVKKDIQNKYQETVEYLKENGIKDCDLSMKVSDTEKLDLDALIEYSGDDNIDDVMSSAVKVTIVLTIKSKDDPDDTQEMKCTVLAYKENSKWYAMPASSY